MLTQVSTGGTVGVAMDLWELDARESIRDLVARYNANGDTGRFANVLELFAPDAAMIVDSGIMTGHAEILTIFTGARDNYAETTGTAEHAPPPYLRHMTATHQIDIIDRSAAKGRCYYQVLTSIGLDHWGRYIDEYRTVEGAWKFATRRVTVDGRSPSALFVRD
jgi:3-phenylpropionate/cinnamic acid dioxygenase small subunit